MGLKRLLSRNEQGTTRPGHKQCNAKGNAHRNANSQSLLQVRYNLTREAQDGQLLEEPEVEVDGTSKAKAKGSSSQNFQAWIKSEAGMEDKTLSLSMVLTSN